MRLIAAVFSLLLILNTAHAEDHTNLFDSAATGEDVRHFCSAVNEVITPDDVNVKDAKSVDRAWTIVSARFQCLSYVSGIIAGTDMHTIKMNGIFHREIADTTFGAVCIPELSQQNVIVDFVHFLTANMTLPQRQALPASITTYSYLAAAYPCPPKNPM
jgi:hypothetical protein